MAFRYWVSHAPHAVTTRRPLAFMSSRNAVPSSSNPGHRRRAIAKDRDRVEGPRVHVRDEVADREVHAVAERHDDSVDAARVRPDVRSASASAVGIASDPPGQADTLARDAAVALSSAVARASRRSKMSAERGYERSRSTWSRISGTARALSPRIVTVSTPLSSLNAGAIWPQHGDFLALEGADLRDRHPERTHGRHEVVPLRLVPRDG